MADVFQPNFLPMAVGSVPHRDPVEACNLILEHLPEIPAWPQLPNRAFCENMYAQYSEGFPGVVLEADRIYVDRRLDLDPDLQQLYEYYIESDLTAGVVSPGYAAGLAEFLTRRPAQAVAVKGQVTGPVSWGLTVTDQDRRPVLYDDVLADAIGKLLRLKAAWQERALQQINPRTIMFVDEPYMSSFGSAYVAIGREQVIALLEEVFGGLQGLKGVHCCGNTDWSLLLSTSVDVLSLDAYSYVETLALYPDAVNAFLARGGIVAWGIVPVDDEARLLRETPQSLAAKLQEGLRLVASKGVSLDALVNAALVTPTCGMRTLSEPAALRALELLGGVAEQMQAAYR